jgi:hypothetical protein
LKAELGRTEWRLSVKVGDLVRHTGSLGMGIVVGPEEHPYEEEGSYVRWLWEDFVSLEMNSMLEALSEER